MTSPTETAVVANPQPKHAFHGVVPDSILADWARAMPRIGRRDEQGKRRRGRPRIGGGFHWAIHQAVIAQRSSRVVVPDVLMGQMFWGGDEEGWPANWRSNILALLEEQIPSWFMEVSEIRDCTRECPLSGTTVHHRHFSVLIRTADDIEDAEKLNDEGQPSEDNGLSTVFLGILDLYGLSAGAERLYDFSLRTQRNELEEEEFKALSSRLRTFKRRGRLVSAYLPLRMFGGSPRLGLSFRQRQLLLAIHRELTRDDRSERYDKAAIIQPGRASVRRSDFAVDHYPGLSADKEYVGFNGNGGRGRERLHGRGYRLLGEYRWLERARYIYPDDGEAWSVVKDFFKDLQFVGDMFGLLVAARHPRTDEWLSLYDLPDRLRTDSGRKWLEKCLVRIYTEQDYLVRWRRTIADRMGFLAIPDQDQERVFTGRPWQSAVQLSVYLKAKGVSQVKAASELKVSKSQFSQYMTGKKPWTEGWQGRVRGWVEARDILNGA